MPASADLVHETTTGTGTGNLTLSTASGKRGFASAFGSGATTNVFDYFISHRSAPEWERGTGHMSDATTLVRDTVLASSNGGAAVSLSAGTKDVVNDVPAGEQDITGLTAETSPATGDEMPIYDASASARRKMTLANVLKVIDALTEDASPDAANDFVATYDASASAAKKVKLSNIGVTAASQAEQEAGSDVTKMVTPGRQHYHASAAKAWVRFNSAGTVAASYNITSITDSGTGDWTVNIAADFSSANYCGVLAIGLWNTGTYPAQAPPRYCIDFASAAGTFNIGAFDSAHNRIDPTNVDEIHACFFGDQ